MLQVSIGGLVARPAVAAVLVGATSAHQVRSNAQALRWRPASADLEELDTVVQGA
jgi:aryl-alcohol dehydrogenase-like predicted oxidoreductase